MDKKFQQTYTPYDRNQVDQSNSNHPSTGPGHDAGTKPNSDNRSKKKNPNNSNSNADDNKK